MGIYVITNNKGGYIRQDPSTGRFVPVQSFKMATQWDNILKASNVLKNSVTNSVRNTYAVQYIETDKLVNKDDMTIQKDICSDIIEDDNISDWLEKVNVIKSVLSTQGSRWTEIVNKLTVTQKKIVDIEHYIEFGNFNAYQGWLLFKSLQNLFRQRRKLKNEIQVLQLIKDCKVDKKSVEALSQQISEIKNKCYTPRVLKNIFKIG